MFQIDYLQAQAIDLLKSLIKVESFSGNESGTARLIAEFLEKHHIKYSKFGNNIVSRNKYFSKSKPTLLLNSHHDTVKVVNGWDYDPFGGIEENGIIYGLGSNDAGASLAALIACFMFYYENNEINFNIILAATAEEETFGPNGIKSLLGKELSNIELGIVGEPTEMNMAIAEKGLIVIDAVVKGKAGHAARKEGENAIYKAMKDIETIESFEFDKVSTLLGPNVMSVTQINAGYQHNVIPDECKYVIDLRVNEKYKLEEAFKILDEILIATLTPRSFNNNSSGIDINHNLVRKAVEMKIPIFGSATLSDQAHMNFPTVKIGPGKSERSHTPNEHIYINEINESIPKYIELLKGLNF